jgi:hypothetical protein
MPLVYIQILFFAADNVEFMGRSERGNEFAGTCYFWKGGYKKIIRFSLSESATMFDKAADVLLKKGIFVRAPYMSYPTHSEYVQKQNLAL